MQLQNHQQLLSISPTSLTFSMIVSPFTGMNYLVSGKSPVRMGNAHPNVAPYEAIECSDGFFILAVGNDRQFVSACKVFDIEEISIDSRFKTNAARIENRKLLSSILAKVGQENQNQSLTTNRTNQKAKQSKAKQSKAKKQKKKKTLGIRS